LTKVLVEDGDHIRIGQTYARHLAQSLIETKETLGANILNRAFNARMQAATAYHWSTRLTQSQLVRSQPADDCSQLSQTSLEQLLIQIRNAVDNNGKRIR
jgi:multidrug efflux pump subunit AcrA (membrane-fusion protein)